MLRTLPSIDFTRAPVNLSMSITLGVSSGPATVVSLSKASQEQVVRFVFEAVFQEFDLQVNLEIREVLQITVTLLANMAKAAISGLRKPAAAIGIPSAL